MIRLVVLLTATTLIFVSISSHLRTKRQNSQVHPQASLKCDLSVLSDASKACILEYIRLHPPTFGRSLDQAIKLCTKVFTSRLTIAHLYNMDDIKEAAKPLHYRESCTVITIGIGDDIEAEKQLKFRIPSCRFFGADPSSVAGDAYKELGHFVQAAISDTDGYQTAKINIGKNRYSDQKVKSTSLLTLLQMISVSVIDFLFLDAEGAEYKLMPHMVNHQEFSNGSITICQIAMEMHGNLEKYGMDDKRFDEWIHQLLGNGSYVPIWSRYGRHMHLFLINTSDQYCIDKYFDIVCSDNVVDEWKVQGRKPRLTSIGHR